MNRRRFLTLGAASAAAMVLDPDLLLWVPGRKAIFDLGPSPVQHVMYGDWLQRVIADAVEEHDRALERQLFTPERRDKTQMERHLFTRVDHTIFGGTITVPTAELIQRGPQATNAAVRDLDAAARHWLSTR